MALNDFDTPNASDNVYSLAARMNWKAGRLTSRLLNRLTPYNTLLGGLQTAESLRY